MIKMFIVFIIIALFIVQMIFIFSGVYTEKTFLRKEYKFSAEKFVKEQKKELNFGLELIEL